MTALFLTSDTGPLSVAESLRTEAKSYQLLSGSFELLAESPDLLPLRRGDVDLTELARDYRRPCVIVRIPDEVPIMVFGDKGWRLVARVDDARRARVAA